MSLEQLTLLSVPVPVEVDGENERYTTRTTDTWCKKKAQVDGWDLDVAACTEAHLADNYYTKANDGIGQPWRAPRVWCNPPWDSVEAWVKKAWRELAARRCDLVAMLLPGNRTDQEWWQEQVEPYRDGGHPPTVDAELSTHFLPGRTVYGCPGNREGIGAGQPPFTSVLLVWRRSPAAPKEQT